MHLSAQLDLGVVALEQPDELTLLVQLTAPTPAITPARASTTLQVVLDRSGSMRGDRLGGARSALLSLVDQLDPSDNLGVVAFDTDVEVVVPAGPLADKDAVRAALRALRPGGRTDLSGGYLRGLQEARRVVGPAGGTVLLISDGHANAGITDPERLGPVAAQAAAEDRLTTSTLGFGLGYDERLLAALAQHGRGTELFAEEADTAAAKIAGEVQGLLEQVAQAASLRVQPGPHVTSVSVLNDLPAQPVGDGVTVELGSFYAGETRKLVLRLAVPSIPALGLAQVATLHLTHVALPDLVQHTAELPVHVNVVPGDEAAGRLADPVVRSEALFQQAQRRKREASRLLATRQVDAARLLLRDTADELRAGAGSLPDAYGAELLREAGVAADLADEVHSGSQDRAAKSLSYDATSKSRLRGRRTSGSEVLLVHAGGGQFLLEEWRFLRLSQAVRSLRSRNDADTALALAAVLSPEDPLVPFLQQAARHGGFEARRP